MSSPNSTFSEKIWKPTERLPNSLVFLFRVVDQAVAPIVSAVHHGKAPAVVLVTEREEIDAILHHTYDEKKEIKFMVNEGDMSNYWTATAANAIKPLMDMIVMATDNLTEKDVVWSGD